MASATAAFSATAYARSVKCRLSDIDNRSKPPTQARVATKDNCRLGRRTTVRRAARAGMSGFGWRRPRDGGISGIAPGRTTLLDPQDRPRQDAT